MRLFVDLASDETDYELLTIWKGFASLLIWLISNLLIDQLNCWFRVKYITKSIQFFMVRNEACGRWKKAILCNPLYTQRNHFKSNRNQIVFTMHQLIRNQTDVCLVPNQSVHGKYNLISVWFNKISKIFLCV